eukprot:1529575-Pleurochrysis_carterae.AAC.1
MTAVDVFGPLMVLWVVGEVDRGLVVQGWRRRFRGRREPMISASHDKRATEGCFFDAQEMAAWLYMKT